MVEVFSHVCGASAPQTILTADALSEMFLQWPSSQEKLIDAEEGKLYGETIAGTREDGVSEEQYFVQQALDKAILHLTVEQAVDAAGIPIAAARRKGRYFVSGILHSRAV